MRESKGNSASSQILTLLRTLSLGNHYVEIGILLRNLSLINSILVNSEVWYPIDENQLRSLEQIDEELLLKILEVSSSTPRKILYLELGIIPIKNIVKCRRIMYLHHILTVGKEKLLYRFFQAQNRSPSKGDW